MAMNDASSCKEMESVAAFPGPELRGSPRARAMEHDAGVGGVRVWCLAGALAVLAGGATTACATLDRSGAPVPPQPTPATSMPSVGPSAHALGQTVDADHAFVEVTVYSYEQPVAQGASAP